MSDTCGLTEKELTGIKSTNKGRMLLEVSANIAEQSKFEVGDILVAYNNGTKQTIKMSGTNTDQKWLVIYKDEANLIYCKMILTGGRIGAGVVLIANCGRHIRYEIDPMKVESILIGQEDGYDPYAQVKTMKRRQDKVRKINKEKKLKFANLKEADDFLATLKVGDRLFYSYSYVDSNPYEYEITAVHMQQALSANSAYGYNPDEDKHAAGMTHKTVVEVINKTHNYGWPHKFECRDIMSNYYNYYKEMPAKIEDFPA